MSTLNVDHATQMSKDTPTNLLSSVGLSQYVQKDPASESTPVYEGFSFSKAMPEESATWTCVKRTPMHLNQDEYSKLVQKRANKKSTAQQYQSLSSDTQRAHINQLIDEQKQNSPLVEWSFVYVKEHTKVSKARNTHRSEYETVTMDVIIMKTPMKTQAYSRPLMGGSEAIGKPFWPDTKNLSMWPRHRQHALPPDQNGNNLRPVRQLLPSQLAPAMIPFAPLNAAQRAAYPDGQFLTAHLELETSHPEASRDLMRESARSAATINSGLAGPGFSARNKSNMSLEHPLDCSSDSDSDSDDASMLSDQSDETSATDDLESMETETETECQEPQLNRASIRKQNASPHRRESIYGPHSPRKPQSRSLDRRHDRNSRLRDQFEVPPVKTFGPRRAEDARSGSVPGRRYRMQLINDNEIRSRMLDHREASLGHREKWLKKTISEARRQPVKDQPTVCRCTCRCAIKKSEAA
ncbi:hypothetical protein N7517_011182 [Penicillium concentricum]|uniref:Uncharacterized protein n=1 Tax=Penicillium concentricum TaxID=293559 RepID=A0A9W9UT50_9EURO|nr:uncharacterized protein N7517_011182 [Penicillium concentricum]KAJ5356573.1 hypothetical protein N7517_011182 [Penicillium concentricum]